MVNKKLKYFNNSGMVNKKLKHRLSALVISFLYNRGQLPSPRVITGTPLGLIECTCNFTKSQNSPL